MSAPSACPICSGSGFEIVTLDGRDFARTCSCRRGREGDPLAASRIPARYEESSLGNFDPYSVSHAEALEVAMRYCNRFPFSTPSDEGMGLLINGPSGVGKTHLAIAILRELVTAHGAAGQFWDFQDLMREIKASYNPATQTSEVEVLSPVIDSGVLVLDDLGAWRMTDWMGDTLFHILNQRYLAKRPTIVTTNYQDASMEEISGADPVARREYFVDRVGNRIRSRMLEMCLVVRLKGDDFRATKQNSHRTVIYGTSGRPQTLVESDDSVKPKRPRFGG